MYTALDILLNAFSREFLVRLEEEITSASWVAVNSSSKFCDPEKIDVLGHMRHWLYEEAFRKASTEFGHNAGFKHTSPKGGSFSFVESNGVHLLRANVQPHCGTPRPSKFRLAYSQFNEWLNPIQFNLFEVYPKRDSKNLCAMLIISHRKNAINEPPAYIGIGIPSDDMKYWKCRKSIAELAAMHNDLETNRADNKVKAVKIIDRAIPKIKDTKLK